MKTILKVEGISVNYGLVSALRNVSVEVNEGEIVALLGANGSGKTTFLETVIGINRANCGHISFLEKDISRKSTDWIVRAGMCLVPEGRGILPLMSVQDNLLLGAHNVKTTVGRNLELVFQHFPILSERRKEPAGLLSGGQQQMLSIGRGMMSEPKLMMLDEPSLGLAPIMVDEVFEIIIQLNKQGQTILLSEQNAAGALQFAHRGYVFETGEICASGTAKELICDSKICQAYLGE